MGSAADGSTQGVSGAAGAAGAAGAGGAARPARGAGVAGPAGAAGVRRATKARHDSLVALMHEGVDGVEELAARVGVSVSTVRRDLTRLQAEGRIARTYGGAMVREEFHERSFGESARIHQPEKAAIARAALSFVPSGGVVFLDAGTTCLALARLLASVSADRPLTVVTRGLEAALLLARTPVSVVVVGGSVRPLSHGVVGPLTSVAFDRLAFDAAFLGADQVSPDRGLGEPTVEETFVKEQAAARASEVYVLADASKMEAASVPAWIPVPPEWTLITDRAAPASVVEGFRGRGVPVVLAD